MRQAGNGPRKPIRVNDLDLLGHLYERELADRERAGQAVPGTVSARRRRDGIYYTPPVVVDHIVEQTLRPLFDKRGPSHVASLKILDPACGCGAFLLGAFRWLCRWYGRSRGDRGLSAAERRAIARQHLWGIDIDPEAVNLARRTVGGLAGLSPDDLTETIRTGDALLDENVWLGGPFGAVLTNPPYVNIRRLVKAHGPALADDYRRRYRCADGAFDLYVLFLERSVAALARGGRIGAIVPNKLATLDYARRCREMLLGEGTLDQVIDVSHLRVFGDADVYPYVVVWTKSPPRPDHAIRVSRPGSLADLDPRPQSGSDCPQAAALIEHRVLQSRQRADGGLVLGGDLDVESRGATAPLGDLCTIHSGCTGFQAVALAARLVDGGDEQSRGGEAFDFIVSGNIDPYAIVLGNVRFMKRTLARPLLAADDPILTERKRRLYAGKKIVLSGMCRRLEAAFDSRGLALGVQVYALVDWQLDPHYLLGLLNSDLLSHLFRLRFAAKRLAGGYFSLSKKQLAALPIRILDARDPRERQLHDRLVSLVRNRIKSTGQQRSAAILDARIDELVSQIYGIAPADLAMESAAA